MRRMYRTNRVFYEVDGNAGSATADSGGGSETTVQSGEATTGAAPESQGTHENAATESRSETGTQETSPQDSGGKPIAESITHEGTKLQLVPDPVTGRPRLKEVALENSRNIGENTPQAEQTLPTTGLMATPQQQGQPASPTPYTVDELALDLQLGTVNEARLTPQQAFKYGQYKERMTQQSAIRQAQGQAERQLAAETNTAKQQLDAKREYLKKLDETAKEMAMKELGFKTQDDLDAAEYSDDEETVKRFEDFKRVSEYNRTVLERDIETRRAEHERKQTELREVQQGIRDYVAKEMASEPHWNEINSMLTDYYKQLPYEQATKYASVVEQILEKKRPLDQAQAAVLKEYYDRAKQEYYARSHGLDKNVRTQIQSGRKPAKVETPGTGANMPNRPADYTALRNMSARERHEWFVGHGF